MSNSNRKKVTWLEEKHRHQHKLVEALEAEKAPEQTIRSAKIKKLKLKDEIEKLKRMTS